MDPVSWTRLRFRLDPCTELNPLPTNGDPAVRAGAEPLRAGARTGYSSAGGGTRPSPDSLQEGPEPCVAGVALIEVRSACLDSKGT